MEAKTGKGSGIPAIIPVACDRCGVMDEALYKLSNVSKHAEERLFCMTCAEAKVRQYERLATINAADYPE